MTNKQKLFVKAKLDNPKSNNTEAAMVAYNVKNKRSAASLGHAVANKPQVQKALQEHSELLESAIIGTVRDWKDSETPREREIATQNAQYAYDHIWGKATVKLEQQSTVVKININLAGDGDEGLDDQDDPSDNTIIDLDPS